MKLKERRRKKYKSKFQGEQRKKVDESSLTSLWEILKMK